MNENSPAESTSVNQGATPGAKWPFIVIRHPMSVNEKPDEFGILVQTHRNHPGACDEFWFATGSRKTIPELEKECGTFARYRALCDAAGILPGYQQGLTLGHGERHDGPARPGETQFPDDAWQRGADGARIPFLCPRSPFVLDYEREYAKTVLRVADPSSYWIDDDLRLGVSKPDGCFCDRCIAAFNEKTGRTLTREALVARLYDKNVEQEPLRAEWSEFNAESLAIYGAQVRKAADELCSRCRIAYQAVSANRRYTASSYEPLLRALSGPGGATVGIRPGHGFYTEESPRGMIAKNLAVAREAERLRGTSLPVASICYEEETYPRHLLNKTPGAILTESALALASGCDSLSLYWFPAEDPLPADEYDRFLDALAAARPYFERLASSTRRTRLGGLARFVGSAAAETLDFDLYDEKDFDLACAGIPVTVANSAAAAWFLTDKSRREMTDADRAALPSLPMVDISDSDKFPLASRRAKLLDDLDAATKGSFPVRVDECKALRVLPRVREDGRLDSVTLLNLSIGGTGPLTIRLRNSAGSTAVWQGPDGAAAKPLPTWSGALPNEQIVRLDSIGAWQIGTIFLETDATPSAAPAHAAAQHESSPHWHWFDGTALPMEGRGYAPERLASPYHRLPADALDHVTPDVRGLQSDTAGLCFRFRTDSRKLRIFWKTTKPVIRMWNMAPSGADGIDVYQERPDGSWHFVKPPFPIPPNSSGAEYTWEVEPELTTLVYLPLYNGIAEFRLGVEPGRHVEAAPARRSGIAKPVVFYGTSITQGASAAHPGGCWVAQAARFADVEAVNLGFSGSGKMEDSMLECLSEIDAALYVLDTVSNMTPELIRERMEHFVRGLAERRPGTPILLTANVFVMGEHHRLRDAAVRAIYDKLKSEDPVKWSILHFAGDDAAALAPDDDGTEDGVHLNDLGMKRAGEHFGRKIRDILGQTAFSQ